MPAEMLPRTKPIRLAATIQRLQTFQRRVPLSIRASLLEQLQVQAGLTPVSVKTFHIITIGK